ncbi:sensor histidine kinase [Pseudoponticoccus marisrubri]|uniref:histidine kinase n=1 Tax=Pseudoponticoccus marisrubri TaxID=1685382 RepID=A0A0W7WH99_9RHOB|nr:ATP-binding protein [Pseudoponticoccus marisrubri]KUF09965.1 histidine kinase [Pseudoponticoccus marisrubri]
MPDTLTHASPDDVYDRISARLAARTDVTRALEAVAGEIASVIPFTHADLCLLDRPGWVVSYEVGIRTRWSRASGRVDHAPIRDLLLGRCDHMLTDDATCDPRYTYPGASCEPILNHALRSRVNVLMCVAGRTIGTLNVSHSERGLYDTDTVARAQRIADRLAPHVHALHLAERTRRSARVSEAGQAGEEGLRRGALELTQALEQERQRVGMDLHDQTLADLSRLLREATGDTPLPRDDLARRLRQTIDDLRRIIDTAVPTLLELFGFAHAVRVHLDRAAGGAEIALSVEDGTQGAPDRLDPTVRTALFRITQEAINNAVRHAGATRIAVTVAAPAPGELCVTIRDDGRGIPLNPARQSGLAHMRTRARLISAALEVTGGGGTTVRVALEGAP